MEGLIRNTGTGKLGVGQMGHGWVNFRRGILNIIGYTRATTNGTRSERDVERSIFSMKSSMFSATFTSLRLHSEHARTLRDNRDRGLSKV